MNKATGKNKNQYEAEKCLSKSDSESNSDTHSVSSESSSDCKKIVMKKKDLKNLNFIKGDKGERGKRGKPGVPGIQGSTGPRGKDGMCGPIGKRGKRGHKGKRGRMGMSFTWKGEWIEGTTYEPYDVVFYEGSCYIAINQTMTVPTEDPLNWDLMVQGISPIPAVNQRTFNLNPIVPRGEWTNGEIYEVNNIAIINGSSYIALDQTILSPLVDKKSWCLLAQGIPQEKLDNLKGECGDKGERGDKGEIGDKGIVGDKGMLGDKGLRGDKGDKGERGDKGEKGEKGDRGDKGINGDKGDKGERGEKGDKGDKGDKGERGDKGDKGDKSPNNIIRLN